MNSKRQFQIGNVTIGGNAPVVVQSMTNTDTADVQASVAQCKRMIDAGAQMVRLTVPSLKEVEPLKEIQKQLKADGYGNIPLIADVHFNPKVAPVKVAVFPLVKKDEACFNMARGIFDKLRKKVNCFWDASGQIGRRYRRQDEAGTPWCITVDEQTVQDGTFTVRERDSMQQKRMTYAEFLAMMYEALEF